MSGPGSTRCISLWQPWASLWLSIAKVHETRHWATTYRGPLVVHAAKRIVTEVDPFLNKLCVREFGSRWIWDLPRGALLGTLDLVDCVPTADLQPIDPEDYACGDFTAGRYGWKRGRFEVLPHSIQLHRPARLLQRAWRSHWRPPWLKYLLSLNSSHVPAALRL